MYLVAFEVELLKYSNPQALHSLMPSGVWLPKMFFIQITESAYENLVCCYISTFGNDIHREYSNL